MDLVVGLERCLLSLDHLIAHYGIKYIFVESGMASTEAKCEEHGLDKSEAKLFWCEVSWGSGDDEFDFAYNCFADTLGEAIGECINMFQTDVRDGESEKVRAAKLHGIYEELVG